MTTDQQQRRTHRRIVLYSTATLSVAVLAYLGFGYVPPPGLDTRMEAVFAATRDNKMAEARRLIDRLHADFPKSVRVVLVEAWLEEYEHRLPEAQNLYRRAVELAPEPEQKRDILLSIADLDRRMGHVDKAETLLEHVTKGFGESGRGRQLRSLVLMDQGLFEDALNEARRLAEEEPGNPHASRLCRDLGALVESNGSPAPDRGKSGKSNR